MKSQIILAIEKKYGFEKVKNHPNLFYKKSFSQTCGFLTVEIMIAFSLFALFTISTSALDSSMQNLKIWSSKELNNLKILADEMNLYLKNGTIGKDTVFSDYGNDSSKIFIGSLNITKSDFVNSWGSPSCSQRINFDSMKVALFSQGVSLGSGNVSTDIEARDSFAYITANSSTMLQSDFFIIDASDSSNPKIISSINTGPGLSAVAVAGPYAYVANTSTNSQFQIIDIHDRKNPHLLSQLKLSLPQASTTPTIGQSIFYKNGFVYLGTSKWDGPELNIINVSDPSHPSVVGSFETNTLINDIYVVGNTAYLATSDIAQMRVLDISNKSNPVSISVFSPSGWQTQEGKVLDYFEKKLSLGRTVGGFNNISNHEVFLFSTSSYSDYISHDFPGGIYGIFNRSPNVFILSHLVGSEFQVWNQTLTVENFSKPLGSIPVAVSCDWSTLFIATGDEKGLSILKLN